MRKLLGILGVAFALCLLTAASASATREFGKRCTGNAVRPNSTALLMANGEESPAFSADAGPWELWGSKTAVITRWRAEVGPGLGPLSQQLVAFNWPGESETVVRNLGESAIETLHEGSNEFATRIPIPEYAHIGLRGPSGALYCEATAMGLIGFVEGPFPAGSIGSMKTEFPDGVPAIAFLEPDRDGDGYGDETQDGCPSSALWHGPCPMVTLHSGVIEVRPGAIVIRPALNVDSRIAVTGTVSWTLPPRKGGPQARAKQRTRTVRLDGGAQNVPANVPTAFRVPLPKAVLKHLGRLSRERKQKANLKIVASGAPELEGRTMEKILNVRLPGRAKPQR